jgi:hypothetical protein
LGNRTPVDLINLTLSPGDLDEITHKIAKRVSRYLERSGYLYRDAGSEYLDLVPEEDDAMHCTIQRFINFYLFECLFL